jgi:branched-chain amino acid transport system permease protein
MTVTLLLVTLGLVAVAYAGLQLVAKVGAKRAAIGAVAVAIAFTLPHFTFTKNTDGILPIFTVVLCAVYALFALGLNIVVGFAGLLDLGYVAFFLFGSYVGAWLMSDFAVNLTSGWRNISFHFFSTAKPIIPGLHLSFWIVIVVAGVVAAIAGVVIGAPTLRLKSDYLALVTLGFGEILPEVFRNGDFSTTDHGVPFLKGWNFTNGTKGIGPVDNVGMGIFDKLPGVPKTIISNDYRTKYYVIMVFCALFVWVSIKLRDGRLGRAWMAIREDELAASLMGVPLMRTKLWSYAVGAVAGGVGGAFYATIVGTVSVETFTFQFSIIVLCAVILGGMGNVWGAISGAVVITWVNYTGLDFISLKSGINFKQYEFALFGLVLVLMMLFRPDGFIPAARSKQVKKAEQLVLATQEEAS